jgi:ribonuclease PH
MRHDGRNPDQLRPIHVQRHFTGSSPVSVYIKAGRTTLLCTASVDLEVPPWKKMQENPSGWLTAEYDMLHGSTSPRKRRDRGKVDGRSTEIQRLIGRSLRAVVDFQALGPRTITVDCEVLEADGGTRTLGITGGFIALVDALLWLQQQDATCDIRQVLQGTLAAVSVGICQGVPLLDLDYSEDSTAEVDLNVVMTGAGNIVEVQGTAEQRTFSREQLDLQLNLAELGIVELTRIQRESFGNQWPLDEIH